jgi:hypothetical protein
VVEAARIVLEGRKIRVSSFKRLDETKLYTLEELNEAVDKIVLDSAYFL